MRQEHLTNQTRARANGGGLQSYQTLGSLEGQHLCCMCLAHYELERILIAITIKMKGQQGGMHFLIAKRVNRCVLLQLIALNKAVLFAQIFCLLQESLSWPLAKRVWYKASCLQIAVLLPSWMSCIKAVDR